MPYREHVTVLDAVVDAFVSDPSQFCGFDDVEYPETRIWFTDLPIESKPRDLSIYLRNGRAFPAGGPVLDRISEFARWYPSETKLVTTITHPAGFFIHADVGRTLEDICQGKIRPACRMFRQNLDGSYDRYKNPHSAAWDFSTSFATPSYIPYRQNVIVNLRFEYNWREYIYGDPSYGRPIDRSKQAPFQYMDVDFKIPDDAISFADTLSDDEYR